jgi:hypothetical protein
VSNDQNEFDKAKSGLQDDVVDDSINSRLTQRLLENAIKDKDQLRRRVRQQPSGIRGMFVQAMTLVGLAGLAIVLSLFSLFDRKEKVL